VSSDIAFADRGEACDHEGILSGGGMDPRCVMVASDRQWCMNTPPKFMLSLETAEGFDVGPAARVVSADEKAKKKQKRKNAVEHGCCEEAKAGCLRCLCSGSCSKNRTTI